MKVPHLRSKFNMFRNFADRNTNAILKFQKHIHTIQRFPIPNFPSSIVRNASSFSRPSFTSFFRRKHYESHLGPMTALKSESELTSNVNTIINRIPFRAMTTAATQNTSNRSSTNLNIEPLTKPGYEDLVASWIIGVAGMCMGMILIGGYTRLSGSGLSMTNWKFQGQFLPAGKEDWERQFEIYKAYPEYQKLHNGNMDLDEFKKIFFVEWFHRMWGRLTGLVFAVPGAYFVLKRAISKKLALQMVALLGMGISQAFLGWWMVKSGFVDPKEHMPLSNNEAPRVSAYRLTTHLAAALTIYSGLIWTGMQCITPPINPKNINTAHKTLKIGLLAATAIVTSTILSGGFVAGNDAGCAYNTWPKMHDEWVPEDVITTYSTKGSARMLFENTATVQFNHRMLAYTSMLTSLACAGLTIAKRKIMDPQIVKLVGYGLPIAVTAQIILGITTLLNAVPTELGVAHQGGGVGVLTVLILALVKLRGV